MAPVFLVAALTVLALAGILMAFVGPILRWVRRARATESSLGQVLGNSLTEIYLFDPESLRFVYVNRGAQANLGYAMPELARLTPIDIKPDFDEASFRALLAPLLSGAEERLEFESMHRRKDGSTYPVQIDLQASRYADRPALVAVVLDVTEREEALRALRDSEEHFRSIIEHSSDEVSVVGRDGRVVYLGPSSLRAMGYSAAEREGHDALELFHPDDREGAREIVDRVFAAPDEQHHYVYRLRHKDGSWQTVEAVGSGRVHKGELQAVFNHRDITERVEAERRQQNAEAQLRHAQKMDTIGTLAGGIAHDFNNLLTPIMGYAEMWASEDTPGEQKAAAAILRAATQAQELVAQILAFGRRTEVTQGLVDLSEVVTHTMGLVRLTVPSSIEVVDRIEGGIEVWGDASQFQQVLMNLCTNAQQAMGDGGTLTVRLGRTSGLSSVLTVSDTGHGMDEVTRSRIFEPFFTTKDVNEGTGLGLAVVYGIVHEHLGSIEVESAVGAGTEFTVLLPLASAEETSSIDRADPAAEGVEARSAPPMVSRRILLVDDDRAIRELVAEILEHEGHVVVACEDGQAGLDRLTAEPEAFDLLLTDQTMPSVTGIELAEKARGIAPGLPAILMSGHREGSLSERLGPTGMFPVISKPFTARGLLGVLDQVLERS